MPGPSMKPGAWSQGDLTDCLENGISSTKDFADGCQCTLKAVQPQLPHLSKSIALQLQMGREGSTIAAASPYLGGCGCQSQAHEKCQLWGACCLYRRLARSCRPG